MEEAEKSVKVPAEMHRKLRIIAAYQGLGMSDAIAKYGGPGVDAEYDRQMAEVRAALNSQPPVAPVAVEG